MDSFLIALLILPILFGLLSFLHAGLVLKYENDPLVLDKINNHRLLGILMLMAALVAYTLPAIDDSAVFYWWSPLAVFLWYQFCRHLWMLGESRLRKRIFLETISIPRAHLAELRSFLGFFGIIPLLLAAPGFIHGSGAYALPVAIGFTLLMTLWVYKAGDISAFLLGAQPLAKPELKPGFDRIIAAAKIPRPEIMVFGPKGGIFHNAFALFRLDGKPGRVYFSAPLLDAFSPEEAAAILAHEIGHLEEHDAARKRFEITLSIVLTALSCYGYFVMKALGLAGFGIVLIPFIICSILFLRLTRMQKSETDGDQRAVELCGDGEVLIRAMEKLHQRNRVSRRQEAHAEKMSTHPSLSRRIQAIRKHMGTAPDVDQDFSIQLFKEKDNPKKAVLFEVDRIHWLEFDGESPPSGSFEPEQAAELQLHAQNRRSLPYSGLASIKLDGRGRNRLLRTVLPSGEVIAFNITEEDTRTVLDILDGIDTKLGSLDKFSLDGSVIMAALVTGLAAFPLSLSGIFGPGATLYLLVGCLPAAATRQRPWIIAQGGLAVGAVCFSLYHGDPSWWGNLDILLFLSVFFGGVYCLFRAPARGAGTPGIPYTPEHRAAWFYILFGAVFLLPSIWLTATITNINTVLWALSANSSNHFLPLLAAGLVFLFASRSFVMGAFFVLLSLLHFPMSTDAFLERFADDPLVKQLPTPTRREIPYNPVKSFMVPSDHHSFRISRDGKHFLCIAGPKDLYEMNTFKVFDFEKEIAVIKATDVIFVDSDELLVLTKDDEYIGTLTLYALAEPGKELWRNKMVPTFVHDADLAITGDSWQVVSERRSEMTWNIRGLLFSEDFDNQWKSQAHEREHYRTVDVNGDFYEAVYGAGDRGAPMSMNRLRHLFTSFYYPTNIHSPDGTKIASAFWTDLIQKPPFQEGTLLLAYGRKSAWLWNLTREGPSPLYQIHPPRNWSITSKGDFTALRDEAVTVLNLETGVERWIPLPFKSNWTYELNCNDDWALLAKEGASEKEVLLLQLEE